MKDPGLNVTTTLYDANSNVTGSIDQNGYRATFTFDELNRKTKTTDALLGVTTMLYDAGDRMTGLIDPVGNRTTFTFDAWGDMTKETDPASKVITHVFDANGRETEKVDRLGQKRDYTYDDAGRVTQEVWKNSGGTIVNTLTYAFDSNGNLLTAGDSQNVLIVRSLKGDYSAA